MERTGEAYVNRDKEDEMEISGYNLCYWKLALVSLGTVCSGGFLLLFLYWLPELSVKWTCHAVPLQEARVLLLRTTDEFRTWFRIQVCSLSAPGSDPLGFPQLSESKRPLCQAVPLEDWDCEEGLLSPPGFREQTEVRFFVHHNTRYFWNVESQSFQRLTALDCRLPFSSLHTIHGSGLPRGTQDYRRLFYGANQIDVQVPSLPKLLIKEVLNPFYIFQVFSMVLWSLDNYYLYASAILFMSLVSICSSLYTIRKQYVLLHDMVATHNIIRVTVYRGPHETEEIFSTELVPGDVLLVPPEGLTVPCDAVLLSGTAIANESMLTGESVPVTKAALPDPSRAANGPHQDPAYDPEEHKRHTLFCGTSVIQTRYYSGEPVRALVIRTGFSTSKGQLVCSILFPKPTDFRLYRDAYRFLLCLVGVAGIGMLYSVIRSVRQAEPVGRIILESLDILTITVPPALPAAMTAGVVYAQRRLRRGHIFSISPQRINVCGQINLMCFDKTGTLTEDGLDFWGFVQAQDGCFLPPGQDLRSPSLTSSPFVAAMAACHSLTTIGGTLSGDPLDLKMFEATGWVLEEPTLEETARHDQIQPTVVHPPDQEPPESPKGAPEDEELMELMKVYQIGLLVQFPFSSALQRMSVVTRTLGEKRLMVYMKGAPETVGSLCHKETVPENFSTVLESYTRRGLRVIALARRRLESKYTWHKVQHISRDIIESGMDFLGLVMLQNKLKPETVPVLAELRRACIRPVMVTGDNLLTAISVGRECGMIPAKGKVILTEALPPRDGQPATINWQYTDELPAPEIPNKASKQEIKLMLDEEELPPVPRPGIPEVSYHFAISGKSFCVISEHFPDLLPKLLLCGTIYARMAPDQKTQLVESLQKMDYYVGMCGDGANDCGALKRAHAGISLSELEASVASPFTSKTPNISCVPDLIREGRAALVTSFCVFKFMALYSIIQYLSVLLLYSILRNLGDVQYLFIDVAIILSLAFTMSLNSAWKELVPQRPPTSLVSPQLLLSVFTQILLSLGFQVGAFLLVQGQLWYCPKENGACGLDPCNITLLSPNVSSLVNATARQEPQPGEEEADGEDDSVQSFENTTLFYISCFQYIAVALAFSKGRPFRQPTRTNGLFVASLLATSGFLLLLLLWPMPALDEFFELACIPYEWRLILLVLALSNLVLSVSLENFVCDCDVLWQRVCYTRRKYEYPNQATYPQLELDEMAPGYSCRRQAPPRAKYKRLAQELLFDPDWPPQPKTSTKGRGPPAESSA
ncbi:LOW QUALITY PROTEIN: polyamine-transporting ATPase 13A3-like [Sceloporus undulatus]|uniref:LOW QUALITY PROTEIN: polyamine-transporting ATPase 13A3-like n=1 Tax=Sceloporus undulatus TaxID=8520 RepID=UPI001C4C3D6D|nr:LOW QUALITY PROTEIN: polyamine-transporting ATPase 13A3-like [Sceloporus undulatus]